MLSQHTLNLHPTLSLRALMVAVCAYVLLMFGSLAYAQTGSIPATQGLVPVDHYFWVGGHATISRADTPEGACGRLGGESIMYHGPERYPVRSSDASNIGLCKNPGFADYGWIQAVGWCDNDKGYYGAYPEGCLGPVCPPGYILNGSLCDPIPSCPSGEHFDASAKQCVCDNGYFRAPTGHRWATQCIRQASGEDFTTHPTWPELAQTYCTGSCMILTDGNEAEVAPTIEGLPNWGSSIPLPGADSGDPDGEDGSTTPGDSAGNNGSGGSGGGGSGTTGGGAGCQPITLPKGTNYFMVVPRPGAEKGC